MKNKSLIYNSTMVVLAAFVSKFLGFVRESAVAYSYGITYHADAYLTALMIPTLLFQSIAVGINQSFIPFYTKMRNENKGDKSFSLILNFVIIISFVIMIIAFFTAEKFVKLLVPGFNNEIFELTLKLYQISIIMTIFMLISSLANALLQVHGNFIIPSAIAIPQNIITIAAILLFKNNIVLVTVITVASMASQVILQIPYIKKDGVRYNWYTFYWNKDVEGMLRSITPIVIGTSIVSLNIFIDRLLASSQGEGAIAALNYANKVYQLSYAIIGSSIVVVMYPRLAKLFNDQKWEKFKHEFNTSLSVILMVIIPICIIYLIDSTMIIKIVFGHGKFDSRAVELTSSTLFFYSIGIIALTVQEYLNRVFYALNNTVFPMVTGILCTIMNIVLSLILIQYLGIKGIALGMSIALILRGIVMLIRLNTHYSLQTFHYIKNDMVKITCSAVIFSLTLYILNIIFNVNTFTSKMTILFFFLITVFIASGVYLFMLKVLNVSIVNQYYDMFRDKFTKLLCKNKVNY